MQKCYTPSVDSHEALSFRPPGVAQNPPGEDTKSWEPPARHPLFRQHAQLSSRPLRHMDVNRLPCPTS